MRLLCGLLIVGLFLAPFRSYGEGKTKTPETARLAFKLRGPKIEKKSTMDRKKTALIAGGGALVAVGTVVLVLSLTEGKDLPGPPAPPEWCRNR